MFTPEQEAYLIQLADKGIAEQQEIADRNAAIERDLKVKEARDAKQAELEAQARLLIDQGLADFDEKEAPKIK